MASRVQELQARERMMAECREEAAASAREAAALEKQVQWQREELAQQHAHAQVTDCCE